MSRLERRIALRSSDKSTGGKSLQELQKLSDDQKALERVQRRSGEGLPEYVERVSGGDFVLLERSRYQNLLVERDRLDAELRRTQHRARDLQAYRGPGPVQDVDSATRTLVVVGGPHNGRMMQLSGGARSLRIAVAEPQSVRGYLIGVAGMSGLPERTYVTHVYHAQHIDNIEALFHESLIPEDGRLNAQAYSRARELMRHAYALAGEPLPRGN